MMQPKLWAMFKRPFINVGEAFDASNWNMPIRVWTLLPEQLHKSLIIVLAAFERAECFYLMGQPHTGLGAILFIQSAGCTGGY